MKIYTKTGDAGQTSLVGGKRVSKASQRLEAYGTIDELNSHLGLLAAMQNVDPESGNILHSIQNRLFNLGAYLATDNTNNPDLIPAGITTEEIQTIEAEIDRLDATLPPLTSFILPGGSIEASQANVARTVCRRAERRLIALADQATVHPLALSYVNRLSDYLFTLGRHLNNLSSTPELPWRP
jgi:cob(I)alamin adenosyltransferase